jgi:DNA-binding CsgD family transcriptional regulator
MPEHEPLTARERDVIRYLLAGDRERAIAVEVGLTYASLHQVVTRIYRKLGVPGRPELMALFLRGPGVTGRTVAPHQSTFPVARRHQAVRRRDSA